MKTKAVITFLCIASMALFSCGTHKTYAYGDHESKVIGSELNGVYVVRATGQSTKVDVMSIARTKAMQQAQKRAVYDIIFSIMTCTNTPEKSLKPILTEVNAKQKYEEYFNDFFADNGEWKQFASTAGTRYQATEFYRSNTDIVCTMSIIVDRKGLINKFKEDQILR